MNVSATEAKNRFGSLCAQAKREPVFVEKAGQVDTVILSAEHYQALVADREKAGRAARKLPSPHRDPSVDLPGHDTAGAAGHSGSSVPKPGAATNL